MASVIRPSWARPGDGGTTERTSRSKATSPARSPNRADTAVSIITASMACSTRGTSSPRPAIPRPWSSRLMTTWLRSARYVRTMALPARAVAAQSMRLSSSSGVYSRSWSNSVPPPRPWAVRRPTSMMRALRTRSSASPLERNGGETPPGATPRRGRRRGGPAPRPPPPPPPPGGAAAGPLAGDQAQRAAHPHDQLGDVEAAPASGTDGRRGAHRAPGRDPQADVADAGPQRGRQLIGHLDGERPTGGVAHVPRDHGGHVEGDDLGHLPLDGDPRRAGGEEQVDHDHRQEGAVEGDQGADPAHHQHHERTGGGHGHQPGGQDRHVTVP